MSEWAANFSEKSMKICFVVLEKLDEKRINQYLQKYGLKKTTENIRPVKNAKPQLLNENIINCNGYFKTEKNSKENGRHKRDNSKDLVLERELVRKKRKIKISGHTDNVPNRSVFEKNEHVTENDKASKLRVTSDSADNRERLKRTYENDKNVTIKYKKNITLEVEKKRNNMILKTLSKDSSRCKSVAVSTEDAEIEIVEEYLNHRNNSQNKNCDKIEASCNEEQLLVSSDLLQAVEEDEYDLREDSEDDKKTIIFEEGIYEDEDSNIFDINEKEIQLARTELKKREIVSQKLQKLIQFKKKSLEDRNLEMIRRPEGKIMESFIGQEATEVLPSPEGVSEDCLKAVCCLIRRLYELYKIITHLQMKLQNNNGLSVYFSKIINSQQEQFQREIRKSQETIIKCYEKMLLLYKNADKVALIISKRTSLSPDEVIEVISQCLFVEGACELEKSGEKAGEEVFQPPKVARNSDSSVKTINKNSERLNLRKMVQKTNYLVSSSHSFFPSGKKPELCQRMTNESIWKLRTPTEENSKIPSQNPSDHMTGISSPQCQMQGIEHENLNSYLIQEKLHYQSLVENSRINQSQQTQSQRITMLPCNPPRHPRSGLAFPNQNVILPYKEPDCPINVFPLQQSSFLTVPTAPVRNAEQFINCNSKNSSANQVGRGNSDISNSGSRVLIPMVAGNIAQCNTLPYQCTLPNNAFLTPSRMVNSQKHILTPSNETRCPLNFVRFPNQKFVNFLPNGLLLHSGRMAESHSRVEGNVSTELRNILNRVSEDHQVLDPTVPKKLTMKNWRLQAGPILDLEIEEEKVTESRDKQNPYQSLKEKKLRCQELGNPDQEDSTTREYICAQTDCKKPGVRICEGCQSVIYCSESCQLKDWTQKHRLECYQLKKLRG